MLLWYQPRSNLKGPSFPDFGSVFQGTGTPPSQGVGPKRPQNFWDLRAHSMRNNHQILHGDQTSREEIFYTVDHERYIADARCVCGS